MAWGFEVRNASLAKAIAEDAVVPYMVNGGTQALTKDGANYIQPLDQYLGPSGVTQAHTILARPDTYDKFIGAFSSSIDSGPSRMGRWFSMTGQCGIEWQAHNTTGTPIEDSTAWGAEFLRADGTVIYSSRRRHVRLRQIIHLTASDVVNYEVYVPLSGFTSKPWIVANDLPLTAAGVGEFSEFVPGLMCKWHAGNTGLTFGWRDAADTQAPGVHGSNGFRKLDASNSDFSSFNNYFWVGDFFVALYASEES